jgi:general L-amino acid transport system substrate-binding protein
VALAFVLALALTACIQPGGGEQGGQAPQPGGQQGGGEAGGGEPGESLLATVQGRGRLICGVNEAVPGFGSRQPDGSLAGFDIDYCKVIAAAVLGDANAVDYVPLVADQRFPALQSGEVDVLSRNTTWTAIRDGDQGGAFVTTTFYDGQGMMVRADSPYQSIEDMANAAVCVLSGTTTEQNLSSRFGGAGVPYEPVPFQDVPTLQQAFTEQRCQGWTSDKSQLAGIRSAWPADQGGPDALRILDETFSKEPLGPAVRDGDKAWFDAVNWAVIATIQAEEFGITQANVRQMTSSDNPEILRFLGQPAASAEGEAPAVFDPGLGIPTDYAVTIIEQVGNYGEIYDRHVGPSSSLGLQRGLNALWTDGGLHYAPPYR